MSRDETWFPGQATGKPDIPNTLLLPERGTIFPYSNAIASFNEMSGGALVMRGMDSGKPSLVWVGAAVAAVGVLTHSSIANEARKAANALHNKAAGRLSRMSTSLRR